MRKTPALRVTVRRRIAPVLHPADLHGTAIHVLSQRLVVLYIYFNALQYFSLEGRLQMPELITEFDDGLLKLTLNRPEKRNALNPSLMRGLRDELLVAEKRRDVKVVVLTGAGGAFCSGGDLKAKAAFEAGASRKQAEEKKGDAPRSPPAVEDVIEGSRRNFDSPRLLHDMTKPTIAMIRGAAAGAGLNLAGACDLRIASENSRYLMPFVDVGLSGDHGGAYFWTRILGTARARELYFLNPDLGARQALEYGMVHRVVPDEQLEDATMEVVDRIRHGFTAAYYYAKKVLNAAENRTLPEVLDMEAMFTAFSGKASKRAMASHKEMMR